MTDPKLKRLYEHVEQSVEVRYPTAAGMLYRDPKRLAFQRQMVKRVRAILDKTDNPRRLDGFHLEYFYWPDLNFGKIFREHVRLLPVEKAYLEAEENAQYKDLVALIVSRPHDNYYIFMGTKYLANVNPDAPILYLNIGGHNCVVMNFKDYLWL